MVQSCNLEENSITFRKWFLFQTFFFVVVKWIEFSSHSLLFFYTDYLKKCIFNGPLVNLYPVKIQISAYYSNMKIWMAVSKYIRIMALYYTYFSTIYIPLIFIVMYFFLNCIQVFQQYCLLLDQLKKKRICRPWENFGISYFNSFKRMSSDK